jgi:hypothetical protein
MAKGVAWSWGRGLVPQEVMARGVAWDLQGRGLVMGAWPGYLGGYGEGCGLVLQEGRTTLQVAGSGWDMGPGDKVLRGQ